LSLFLEFYAKTKETKVDKRDIDSVTFYHAVELNKSYSI